MVEIAEDPLLGQVLNGYRVKRLIAEGGMGRVYEAEHEAIRSKAAVKVLKEEVAANAEWSKRFIREAQGLAALRHRNIVAVQNFGALNDGRSYLMLEFLSEGEELRARMDRQGTLFPSEALPLFEQIFTGLAAAHKVGIVHRDMKPENVYVQQEHGDTVVKIMDFGLARVDGEAAPSTQWARPGAGDVRASIAAGTPHYVAPETVLQQEVGPAADLYACGVMLFEALSGKPPFDAELSELLRMHAYEQAPALRGTGFSEELEKFVAQLLAKNPADRPVSADACRQRVQRLMKEMQSALTMQRPMPVETSTPVVALQPGLSAKDSTTAQLPLPRPVEKKSRRGLIALAAVLLISAAAAWLLRRPAESVSPLPPVTEAPAMQVDVQPAPVAPVQPVQPKSAEVISQKPAVEAPVDDPPLEPLPPRPPKPLVVAKATPPAPVAAAQVTIAPAPGSQVEVIAPDCQASERWRKASLARVAELAALASKKDVAAGVWFEGVEPGVSQKIRAAGTASECAEVERQLASLQAELKNR